MFESNFCLQSFIFNYSPCLYNYFLKQTLKNTKNNSLVLSENSTFKKKLRIEICFLSS